MSSLLQKKCDACNEKTPALGAAKIGSLLSELRGWRVEDEKSLHKDLVFKDFSQAMMFVGAMAYLAEREGHHPDFSVHGWNKVHVTLSTHAIGGLSENDFILAAKIDALLA